MGEAESKDCPEQRGAFFLNVLSADAVIQGIARDYQKPCTAIPVLPVERNNSQADSHDFRINFGIFIKFNTYYSF